MIWTPLQIISLIFTSGVVAVISQRLRISPTVGLLIAGLLLSVFGIIKLPPLTGSTIYSLFLPPLIFEVAFYMDWKKTKVDLPPIILLATVGVVFSAAFTAFGMHVFGGWDLVPAILFGTLIAATDPVSVVAIFKESHIGGRIKTLVEGESLLNDGVAAVLFSVALIFATGHPLSGGALVLSFGREVIGGIGLGAVIGLVLTYLAGHTEDHLVHISITTTGAFGSFLLAQHFGASGVLSTMTCGLILGSGEFFVNASLKAREVVDAFWEYAAFAMNSIIFILIGAKEATLFQKLPSQLFPFFVALVVVTLARFIVVYPLCSIFNRSKFRIEMSHQHLLFWGGLRGALALALAMSIPETVIYQPQIIAVTFGVVAASVVSQGASMPSVLKKLNYLNES